jgi:hypothetical protein
MNLAASSEGPISRRDGLKLVAAQSSDPVHFHCVH